MIEHYVQEILTPWLHARGLPASAIPRVAEDVRQRLLSALSRWGKVDYRRTLLLPAREEAVFYEPRAIPLDIRSLVVLCVRNSLVEDWCSVAAGRESPLNDADVIDLTQTAMTYFAGHVTRLGACSAGPQPDLFEALPTRYPAAWRALAVLSVLPDGLVGIEYDPVAPRRPALPLPPFDPHWQAAAPCLCRAERPVARYRSRSGSDPSGCRPRPVRRVLFTQLQDDLTQSGQVAEHPRICVGLRQARGDDQLLPQQRTGAAPPAVVAARPRPGADRGPTARPPPAE